LPAADPDIVRVTNEGDPWWVDFLVGIAASAIGGAVVLALGFYVLERRLHLRDQQAQREAIRDATLKHVLSELKSNATTIGKWFKSLDPKDGRDGYGVPYPGFDVTGWSLVAQTSAATAVSETTFSALAQIYNRLISANGQLALLSDLNYGSTAVLVGAAAAPVLDTNDRARDAYAKFKHLRDETVRGALLERLRELQPKLHEAIDAVERELGIEAAVPSAQRHYEAG
jgi:hypothetical protein